MLLRELYEQDGKTAVVAFGRLNPPTVGHAKLVDKVKSIPGNHFLFLSHTQKPKTDPLDFATKKKFAQQFFPGVNIGHEAVKTPVTALEYLQGQGYTDVIFVAGSDRVEGFQKLFDTYNGQPDKTGKIPFKFNSIRVVSAGERDPDADDVSGMSASKMRAAAAAGDLQSFAQGVPDKRLAQTMYDAVRAGMGVRESVTEGYKLRLERDDNMMILNIIDTNTGYRTEVRGKAGYETNGYDANDRLHQLLDRIGKSANISELINGEVVTINPKHPKGPNSKKELDRAYNENFADHKLAENDNSIIDNKDGWGEVPNNREVDYLGMRVMMSPKTFIDLAAPLQEEPSGKILQHIQDGGKIASPFLIIEIPQSWKDGDFSMPATVIGHEGRNRMIAVEKVLGNNPIEVHIFPNKGMRARHITDEMKKMLNRGLVKEKSKSIVKGPLFSTTIGENFADGKKPGRKGLAKRSGVNTKASVSSLRKTAKNSSGEKQRMAHWLANMKAGRAKKK